MKKTKLRFTEKQYEIVEKILSSYVTAYDKKRGRIYVKCNSDSQMLTAWDIIEKTDINPARVNYCLNWAF